MNKLTELRLALIDLLKKERPKDYYRLREMIFALGEEIASLRRNADAPREAPREEMADPRLFEMTCRLPNMCVVSAPTGENIDIRIADGQLRISVNTNAPTPPACETTEYPRNRFFPERERIYYHKVSLQASTRNA
ncbi:MAG: hypothetical protein EBS89_08695 [Proteobacteria bacterium]|nr:hypothetical protein [Pseudomonadota bacterium]